MNRLRIIRSALCLLLCWPIHCASSIAAGPGGLLAKPSEWFASSAARQIGDHILTHQSPLGGWPKNTDTTKPNSKSKPGEPTFDNGATTDELRFLAKLFVAQQHATDRAAFALGLQYVLTAQYSSGGWPQSAPPPSKSYHRHITLNDNSMVRIMEFLREVAQRPEFEFVSAQDRQACQQAFDRGIACLLKCQIRVAGKLTAWCAQHDEITLEPRPARSYELVSLSGSESVNVVRLLMSIEQPNAEVQQAVHAAVAWFQTAQLNSIKITEQKINGQSDKVVVSDPKASPLWARFYTIETNQPLFADRDGIAKPTLAEIGAERRNGYAWYGTWPQKLLDQEYPAWKKRLAKK